MNKSSDIPIFHSIARDSVLFIIVFFVIHSLVNSCFSSNIQNSLPYKKEQSFNKAVKNIKLVALGDSHTLRAIDTRKKSSIFNYGVHSEDYLQNYFRLKGILNNKESKIESVIIPFEPHNFYRQLGREFYSPYWSQKMSLSVIYFQMQIRDRYFLSQIFLSRYFPYFMSLKSILDQHHGSNPNQPLQKPKNVISIPEPKHLTGKERQRVKQRIKSHFQGGFNKHMRTSFEELVSLAKDSGLEVIFIQYPLSQKYYKAIPEPELNKFLKYRQDFLDKNKDCSFLNYLDLFPSDPVNEEIYFRDLDDLSPKGSEIFTPRLKKDLEL